MSPAVTQPSAVSNPTSSDGGKTTATGQGGGGAGSRQNLKNTFAGAAAGCVSSIVTCPLDVAKTRLQNQAKGHVRIPLYQGTFGTLRRIAVEEGVRGLYRGLGPTVMGYLPTWAIYFATYDSLKNSLAQHTGRSVNHPLVHILSAMGAGATSSISTNPLWVIKTRLMTQNQTTAYRYTNTLHAFQSILQQEGWRGLYKGLGTSMIGLTHVVIHFPLYEKLKLWLRTVPYFSTVKEEPPFLPPPPPPLPLQRADTLGDEADLDRTHPEAYRYIRPMPHSDTPMPDRAINSKGILLSSTLSKLTASVITYPHEVIRTRLQNQARPPFRYLGIGHAVQTIFAEEGWLAFYKGLGTNLLRTVPASAVTLLTYELLVRYL
ncbi:hypothetical protein H4R34_003698 [Dimargaris verticillata]|uniref:Mitochondrial carrier domain-containing protein n=1 Tax=Dimargaris verticillata TaxID=2761393 RepID=A0A9W8B703_9FUNG|nr:hypothetical protein H4R34_003698 [Dimargaris verticillata]